MSNFDKQKTSNLKYSGILCYLGNAVNTFEIFYQNMLYFQFCFSEIELYRKFDI